MNVTEGFDVVMDTTLGREISLYETAKEFVKRFKAKKLHLTFKTDSVEMDSNKDEIESIKSNSMSNCGGNLKNECCGGCNTSHKQPSSSQKKSPKDQPLPFLTSNCPGWICYAEKTQTSKLLQHISNIKSPQQIISQILKSYLSNKLNVSPSDIYHVSIAPCYDKKLEGTRADFVIDGVDGVVREVDCVLSTS